MDAADTGCCAPSGSRTFVLGSPPFFVRRRGTRPPPSLCRSSSLKEKGDVEVVGSGETASGMAASSLGSPARREVETSRHLGGACGTRWRRRLRGELTSAVMDLFNHMPM